MTLQEVMSELEQMGTEQTRKTWLNHGARGAFFGVKIGDMKVIQKKIKHNHALALELYQTGNADAMYFAGLISEPKKMTKEELQDWAQKANWSMLSEYTVAWAAAERNFGRELAMAWIGSKEEHVQAAGWNTYSSLLMLKKDEELDLVEIEGLLEQIKTSIHNQAERTKYTMNGFIIAVGGQVASLGAKAKAVAAAIGKVSVDMGGTACKVPDAIPYIEKIEQMGKVGKKKKTVFC